MPYLFFYLLYYWRKWPVNPLPPDNLGPGNHLPPLLHVYWTLHVIHVVLGLLALRAGRQSLAPSTLNPALSPSNGPQPSVFRPLTSALWPLASDLLPWLLLALIFYIPGAYLEWPSDPWEHYARTNEWSRYLYIGSHSAGYKSGYFISTACLVGSARLRANVFGWIPTLPEPACCSAGSISSWPAPSA